MNCPLCKSVLNIKLQGFTCYEAVNGSYLKGSVALVCSSKGGSQKKGERCRYMHTTNFKTESPKTLAALEKIVGELIHRLPSLGPWEVFALREREQRKPRRRL